MRTYLQVYLGFTACLVLGACADDGKSSEDTSAETGDGDPGDGDGDGDGDPGDGDPGDGDGDPGDGDGDPGTGDGDGAPGDGDGEPGDCAAAYESCDELTAAFGDETNFIRVCLEDSQCGQELPGTSCGCTRNWVARLDADPECFYALIDRASELNCDLGLDSTCDCPAVDGFICDDGTCNWNYL